MDLTQIEARLDVGISDLDFIILWNKEYNDKSEFEQNDPLILYETKRMVIVWVPIDGFWFSVCENVGLFQLRVPLVTCSFLSLMRCWQVSLFLQVKFGHCRKHYPIYRSQQVTLVQMSYLPIHRQHRHWMRFFKYLIAIFKWFLLCLFQCIVLLVYFPFNFHFPYTILEIHRFLTIHKQNV